MSSANNNIPKNIQGGSKRIIQESSSGSNSNVERFLNDYLKELLFFIKGFDLIFEKLEDLERAHYILYDDFDEKTKNFYPKLKDEIHKSLEEIDTMFLDMEKKIRDNIDELYDSKGIIEMRMKLNKKK